jgi:hypothetical protein
MSEEVYSISFRSDAAEESAKVRQLRDNVASLGDTLTSKLKTDTARKAVEALGSAIDALGKRQGVLTVSAQLDQFLVKANASKLVIADLAGALTQLGQRRVDFKGVGDEVLRIGRNSEAARDGFSALAKSIDNLANSNRSLGAVENALYGLNRAGWAARDNVSQIGKAIAGLGSQRGALDEVKAGVEGVQRKAYGAAKNVEDLGKNLASLPGKAGSIAGVGSQLGSLRKTLSGASGSARRVGTSIGGWVARIGAISAVRAEVERLGEAFAEAREKIDKGGRSNLRLRDRYRELANLQGKAEPDNATIAGALRFRLATGATDQEANEALRRFEGGLPAALKRGNLSGSSTSGLAGDYLRETTRTGLRVAVKGGTSALLAAKLAQTQKIGSVDSGLSQVAAILDSLNRGDGDLDPLVAALVQGSGGLVGTGSAFGTLGEAAAAQSVASLNASPRVAMTRVRQASSGLQRLTVPVLTKEQLGAMSDHEKEAWIAKNFGEEQSAKLTTRKARTNFLARQAAKPHLGITPGDFAKNIERLTPLLEGKEDADAELHKAGVFNQAERRALVQFWRNRDLLRSETDSVTKGVDPVRVRSLNAQFFQSDDAQARIAKAEQDASRFAAHTKNEPLVILREKAEARLRNRGDLDTFGAQAEEAAMDGFLTRAFASAAYLATGRRPPPDVLPLSMGGKPSRAMKIDKEAARLATEQAAAVGFDPRQRFPELYNGSYLDVPEDQLSAASAEIRRRGGSPYGGSSQSDAILRQLVRETQRTNELLQQGQKAAAPPPLPRKMPGPDAGNLGPRVLPPGVF